MRPNFGHYVTPTRREIKKGPFLTAESELRYRGRMPPIFSVFLFSLFLSLARALSIF